MELYTVEQRPTHNNNLPTQSPTHPPVLHTNPTQPSSNKTFSFYAIRTAGVAAMAINKVPRGGDRNRDRERTRYRAGDHDRRIRPTFSPRFIAALVGVVPRSPLL